MRPPLAVRAIDATGARGPHDLHAAGPVDGDDAAGSGRHDAERHARGERPGGLHGRAGARVRGGLELVGDEGVAVVELVEDGGVPALGRVPADVGVDVGARGGGTPDPGAAVRIQVHERRGGGRHLPRHQLVGIERAGHAARDERAVVVVAQRRGDGQRPVLEGHEVVERHALGGERGAHEEGEGIRAHGRRDGGRHPEARAGDREVRDAAGAVPEGRRPDLVARPRSARQLAEHDVREELSDDEQPGGGPVGGCLVGTRGCGHGDLDPSGGPRRRLGGERCGSADGDAASGTRSTGARRPVVTFLAHVSTRMEDLVHYEIVSD